MEWWQRKTLSFGKYRDFPLEDVPKAYLLWVLKSDCSKFDKKLVKKFLNGQKPQPSSGVMRGRLYREPTPEERATVPWDEEPDPLTDEFLSRVKDF